MQYPRLKVLNLAKNKLQCVPQLRLIALNTKKTHVLPTAEVYTDEKVESEAHDVIAANCDTATENGISTREVVREEGNDSDNGDMHIRVHPSNEIQNEDSLENLGKRSAKQEIAELENFQFAELEEDGDTTLEFDSKEHLADVDAAAGLGGSSFGKLSAMSLSMGNVVRLAILLQF